MSGPAERYDAPPSGGPPSSPLDLGHGVRLTWLTSPRTGTVVGFVLAHPHVRDASACEMRGLLDLPCTARSRHYRWRVVAWQPPTFAPPVRCRACGLAGAVVHGRWESLP